MPLAVLLRSCCINTESIAFIRWQYGAFATSGERFNEWKGIVTTHETNGKQQTLDSFRKFCIL